MRGTWQITDSGGGGLVLAVIAAVVLIGSGAAAALVEAAVELVIAVAAATVALGALAVAAGVWLARRIARHDAEVYAALPRSDRPGQPIALKATVQPPPHAAAVFGVGP